MSRLPNLGWFRRTEVVNGRVIRDMRVNRKGRRRGSKNKLPRVPYICPNCHQRMTAAWARVLKRRYKREHGPRRREDAGGRGEARTIRDGHGRTRGDGDGTASGKS